MCVLVAQSCPTLCDLMDYSHQAPLFMELSRQEYRWVAIPFSRRSSQPRDRIWVSCIADFYHLSHQGKWYCKWYIFLNYLFIHFWLHWIFIAAQTFPSCGEKGLLSSCGAQASHSSGFVVAEHRLQAHELQ